MNHHKTTKILVIIKTNKDKTNRIQDSYLTQMIYSFSLEEHPIIPLLILEDKTKGLIHLEILTTLKLKRHPHLWEVKKVNSQTQEIQQVTCIRQRRTCSKGLKGAHLAFQMKGNKLLYKNTYSTPITIKVILM